MRFNKYRNDKLFYALVKVLKCFICTILFSLYVLLFVFGISLTAVIILLFYYWVTYFTYVVAHYGFLFLLLGYGPLILPLDDGTLIIYIFPILIVTKYA